MVFKGVSSDMSTTTAPPSSHRSSSIICYMFSVFCLHQGIYQIKTSLDVALLHLPVQHIAFLTCCGLNYDLNYAPLFDSVLRCSRELKSHETTKHV